MLLGLCYTFETSSLFQQLLQPNQCFILWRYQIIDAQCHIVTPLEGYVCNIFGTNAAAKLLFASSSPSAASDLHFLHAADDARTSRIRKYMSSPTFVARWKVLWKKLIYFLFFWNYAFGSKTKIKYYCNKCGGKAIVCIIQQVSSQ